MTECGNEVEEYGSTTGRKVFPVRYVVAALTVLGVTVEYMLRLNLNVAIVSMVKPVHVAKQEHLGKSTVCPVESSISGVLNFTSASPTSDHSQGEFDWSPSSQGIVLGAFYYGYIVSHIPGGRLSELIGGKWLCGLGILISVVINFLTPLAAKMHLTLMVLSRVILGLAQGVIFPAAYAIFAVWLTPRERSTVLPLLNLGGNLGAVVTLSVTGFLCDHGFAGGWPSAFHVSGFVGTAWCVVWFSFMKSKPENHPFVSGGELLHIQENNFTATKERTKKTSVPWFRLLSSPPVWAVAVAKFSGTWGYLTLASKLPAYLEENGLFNASLFLAISVTLVFVGYLAELLIRKHVFTRTMARKVFELIALFGSSICLALIPFAGCDKIAAMCLLVGSMFIYGFFAAGDAPICHEMSSNFPATLFSITNGIASLTGMLTPWISGLILETVETESDLFLKWSFVFYLAAGIEAIGALVFALLASAEIQKWDMPRLKSAVKNELEVEGL